MVFPLQTTSFLLVFLFIVNGIISSNVSSHKCDLMFNSKQSMGYEQGTQLQVCCNVSSVAIWKFDNPTNFSLSTIAFEQEFTPSQAEMWSELQLSKCTDRSEATIGYVEPKPGVNCTYKVGQTLNIQQKQLEMPEWYVICFQKSRCQSCRLDAICDNDLSSACSDINIIGSATTSTNSSIKYWYTVGEQFPFTSSSTVEVTVVRQRTMEIVQKEEKKVKNGEKVHLLFEDLFPSEWYVIRRCLIVSLPSSLSSLHSLSFDTNNNRLCVEEAYRTANTSPYILFSSVFMLFVLSMTHLF